MLNAKRNSAITMRIIDPEAFDDKEPITDLISLVDKLLIIKTNSVYQPLLPEEIDKDNIAPNTKSAYAKVLSVGSSNPCLLLGFIQFKPLVDFSKNKDILLQHLWNTTQYLLICENSLKYIYKETDKRIPECNSAIARSKQKTYIPLPAVPLLDNYIAQFLLNAKHCLINIFKEFNIMFKTPNREGNFEAYYKWFQERKEQYQEIYLTLSKDILWVKKASNLRNAIEHPREGQRIEVRNITLLPGNKIMLPSWRYDLSSSGCGKQDNFSDIVNDMSIILNNILSFQEDITVLCLNQELKDMNIGVRIFRNIKVSPNDKGKFFISRI